MFPNIDTSTPSTLERVTSSARETLLGGEGALNLERIQDAPVDYWTLQKQRHERESKATTGDYFDAIVRQDSPVVGLVAWAVGKQMTPQEGYSPHAPENWKALTEGLPEEYHHHLYDAVSPAHGEYLRSLIFDKISDQRHLSDMSFWGNAARVGLNFLEPTNLAVGMASGGVASVALKAGKLASAGAALGAARTAGKVSEAAVEAGHVSRLAAMQASPLAMAGGIASGAAGNAAIERLRQSVSFEDNDHLVLDAALMGAVFSAPFAYFGSRAMARVSKAAAQEREVLGHVADLNAGKTLAPEAEAQVKAYLDHVETVGKAMRGEVEPPRINLEEAQGARVKRERATELRQRLDERFSEWKARQTDDWARVEARVEAHANTLVKEINAQERAAAKAEPTAMELAFLKAGAKQKIAKAKADAEAAQARTSAWDKLEADQASQKSREMNDLWAEGHVAKAEQQGATPEPQKTPDNVNAAPADVSPALRGEVADEGRVTGQDVFWATDEGDLLHGTVVRETANGRLMVRDAGGRVRLLDRAELDVDSPLYREGEVPEGFLAGSVGSAQIAPVERSMASPDELELSAKNESISIGGFRLGLRGDIFAVLNRSKNNKVRSLVHMLVKDPIGNSAEWAQGWTASELKREIQRRAGGLFHKTTQDAYRELTRDMGWSRKQADQNELAFFQDVSRLVRGDRSVLTGTMARDTALNKSAQAFQGLMREMLERAQRAGVQGAEHVQVNEHYVPRSWDHNAIRGAEARYGGDAVAEVILNAYRANRGRAAPWDMDVAKRFLTAVKKLEYKASTLDIQLGGRDMATLRKELDQHGLNSGEIDAVVDAMFDAHKSVADAGNAPAMKFRFGLDETASVHVNGEELRLSDLFENDSRVLVDKYLNTFGGHIALAEKGIKSRGDFEAAIREAQELHSAQLQDTVDAAEINREIKLLSDIHANITGRPMSSQSFNRLDRMMTAGRGYARSLMLGQLGLSAAFEAFNAIGLAGLKASLQQMPALKEMLLAFRKGYVPDKALSDDILHMSAAGLELYSGYLRSPHFNEFVADAGLTKFEDWANRWSHRVDRWSGNHNFTAFTRHMAGLAFTQKHLNLATGAKQLDEATKLRLVHQGVNRKDIDAMLGHLKQYAQADGSGRLQSIDWEQWQAAHPETYDAYTLVLRREIADAIQDHDLGETMAWMHSSIGKVFGELRTFMLVSHAKQFLKGVHYRDSTMAMQWMMAFVGQSLAYMLQTSLNFAHNPQEREKRLSLDRIVSSVTQRMSVLGMLPMVADTGYWLATGGDRTLLTGTSANTENRMFFRTPSLMVAGRMLDAIKVGAGAVNPLVDTTVTNKEMRNILSLVPFSNGWGARNIVDFISSSYPKSEPHRAID